MNRVRRQDQQDPESYRPVVAIGHTKDPMNLGEIDSFLSYLKTNQIPVRTFTDIYPKLAKTCFHDSVYATR
jgi:hypothetical protein